MSGYREPSHRSQLELFPRSLEDYVPVGDSVRAIDCIIDELDLSEFTTKYASRGRPSYSPRVLIKLLVYGKIRGIFSARKLAQACQENVRFMYLCSRETPNFRTIALFRKKFQKELGALMAQTVVIGMREGLITLEHVAIDGTKVRAYASKKSFRTQEQLEKDLEQLESELQNSFSEDVNRQEQEDDEFGDSDGGTGDLPAELHNKIALRGRIRKALEKSKERTTKRASTTDVDAHFMRGNEGIHPYYNCQASVDEGSGMAVGGIVFDSTSDSSALIPNLDEIAQNTGKKPKQITADRGYNSKEQLVSLEERGIDGYIPQPEHKENYRENFTYNEEDDTYICKAGRILRFKALLGSKHRRYVCDSCDGCQLKSKCIKNKGGKNRHLSISIYEDTFKRMIEKCATEEGKSMRVRRSHTVEPIFGVIKANKRFRQFQVRGKRYVEDVWKLTLASLNIEKLAKARMV